MSNFDNLYTPFNSASFCARQSLDRLIDFLKANSLRSWLHTVTPEYAPFNWQAYTSELHSALNDRGRYVSCFDDFIPIVRLALQRLDDHHSAYVGQLTPTSCSRDETKIHYPAGNLIGRNTGYLMVPATTHGFNEEYNGCYAQRLLGVIRDLEHHGARNWIVDLRDNCGGNVWPMLAGLSPLLGDGTYGHFVCKDGPVPYGLHDITSLGYETFKLREPGSLRILIGENTASSGELVCTAFKGCPDTALLGQTTCGLTTINSPYEVWNGHYIYYTSGVVADRNRKLFGGVIEPDFEAPKHNEGERDLCLERALQSFASSRKRKTPEYQPH